eukprot:gene3354-6026_t
MNGNIKICVDVGDTKFEINLPRSAQVRQLQSQIESITAIPVGQQTLLGFTVSEDNYEDMTLDQVVPPDTKDHSIFVIGNNSLGENLGIAQDPLLEEFNAHRSDSPSSGYGLQESPNSHQTFRRNIHKNNDIENDFYSSIVGSEEDLDASYFGETTLMSSGEFTVSEFLQSFRNRQALCPLFFEGSFTDAVHEAARCNKPLLLYLHDERSPQNKDFAKLLCKPEVVSKITNYFIAYAYDFTHRAARKCFLDEASHIVHLTDVLSPDFPCVTWIARVGGLFQMGTCITANDVHTAEEFAMRLEMEALLVLSQTLGELNDAEEYNPDGSPKTSLKNLREEQDAAYKRSLEIDQEKARRRQQAHQKNQQLAEANRDLEQARVDMQSVLAKNVREEPAPNDPCIMIRFRLPDNEVLTRKFQGDATFNELQSYTGSLGYLPTTHRIRFPPPTRAPSDSSTQLNSFLPSDKVTVTVEKL